MELRLDDEQARFLRDLLDRTYGDIKYEIADTDDSKFKDGLQREKSMLEALIERMDQAGVPHA